MAELLQQLLLKVISIHCRGSAGGVGGRMDVSVCVSGWAWHSYNLLAHLWQENAF